MNLVIITGAPAVGKMTVGQELAKLTGYGLMHNHLAIEPVLEMFGDCRWDVIMDVRELLISYFIGTDKPGLIFTYLIDYDDPLQMRYLQDISSDFDNVLYVELTAPFHVRLARNTTPNRLEHKASKRDIEVSNQRVTDQECHRMVSVDGEIPFDNFLRIDNTKLSAVDAAAVILMQMKKYGL